MPQTSRSGKYSPRGVAEWRRHDSDCWDNDTVDVRFINPFISAIKLVFGVMLDTKIQIDKPRIKSRDARNAEVTALIDFSGGAIGCVGLCFPMRTAIRVASIFSNTVVTVECPEFADALGELTNMVAGQAKAKLGELNVNVSLPHVVVGCVTRLLDPRRAPVLILPCDSTLGRFQTEVTMSQKLAQTHDINALQPSHV